MHEGTPLAELQAAASRAEAAREWEKAGDLYTQALARLRKSRKSAAARYELLGRRAHCLRMLGRFVAEGADLDAMFTLAYELQDLPRQADTLLGKSDVAWKVGRLAEGRRMADEALALARQVGDRKLEAWSLVALANICQRTSDYVECEARAEDALRLYRELNDPAGEASALYQLGALGWRTGQTEQGRARLGAALEIYRRLGDRAGEADALNVLGNVLSFSDLSQALACYEQGLAGLEAVGNRERISVLLSNLANAYLSVGLPRRACEEQRRVEQMCREMGTLPGVAYSLNNQASAQLELGDAAQAERDDRQSLALARETGDRKLEAGCLADLGRVLLDAGRPTEAQQPLLAAREIGKELNVPEQAIVLARMGAARLALGDVQSARQATAQAIDWMEAHGGTAGETPTQEVWWWRYAALAAGSSSLAAKDETEVIWHAIDRARATMLTPIASLSDDGLRRNYLIGFGVHRQIVQAWLQEAKRRDLSLEPLAGALRGPAGGQLQFQRLLDIGVRLNARRDAAGLARFIAESVVELIGAQRAELILISEDEQGAHPQAPAGLEMAQALLDEAAGKRAALLRCTPEDVPELDQRSLLCVPLITSGKLVGLLYAELAGCYGRFTEQDRDLLSMFANQAAVAVENSRWTETLERRVEERTTELNAANQSLEQRLAELTILNRVGQGLVKQLDFQGIVDLVGDELQRVFPPAEKANTHFIYIALYDEKARRISFPYWTDALGLRIQQEPVELGEGLTSYIIDTRRPLLLGTWEEGQTLGAVTVAIDDGTDDTPQSWMGVPILVGERLTGVIAVMDPRPHLYDEASVRLLTTLAASLGTALENARLFEETRRLLAETEQRNAELAVINSVQQGLAAQLDMQAIFELIGDAIQRTFNAQATLIVTYDMDHRVCMLRYACEKGERAFDAVQSPLNELAAHLIRTREPVLINQDAAHRSKEYGLTLVPGSGEPKSLLFVPLIMGGQVTGCMSLQNMDRENAFSEADVRLLTTLAASMNVALENARLFEETRRLLAETEQRNNELAVINKIQQGLASKLDFQAIVDMVGDKLSEVLATPDLGIGWYDEKANLIHTLYQIEHGKRLSVPSEPPKPGGVCETLKRTRQPLVWNASDEGESQAFEVVPGTDCAKSGVFVPIISSDRVLGSLALENHEREHAFGPSELRLLTTIAASLGTALENARLFEETQRLLKETEQRNAELAVISRVGQKLAAQLDPQGIYDLMGEELRQVFDAQVVAILTYDRAADLVHWRYSIEKGERQTVAPRPPAGFSGHIFKTRQPLLIGRDLDARAAELGSQVVAGQAPKSYLGVPLIAGGEAIAVVALQNVDREEAFGEADLRLLTTLSLNMGVALENARLFVETRRLLAESEQRASELAIINSVSQALASKLDVKAILALVGEKAREIFKGQNCFVALYDKDTDVVSWPYFVSGGHLLPVEPEPMGPGLTAIVIRTRQPLVLGTDEEQFKLGAVVVEDGTPDTSQSWMGVPILIGGEAIGVVALQDDEPNRYAQSDARLLSTIAANAGVALENARLYAATQETQRRLTDIINFLPDATLVIDHEGRVIAWNRAMEEMTGIAAAEMLGQGEFAYALPFYGERRPILVDLVFKPREELEQHYAHIQRQGSVLVGETYVPSLRGDARYLLGTASILHDSKGNSVGGIETIRDITDRKRAEEALAQAKLLAESATQAKSAFLAMMSHEIRTPMNAIIGMSGLLLDTPLSVDQRDYAETVRNSGDALLTIINDILDFSKIEAGKMELEQQPFDLRECVESALDLMKLKTAEKGLELACDVASDVPAAIAGDVTRLRQILVNLLSNAVKFTETGEVVVTVERSGEATTPLQELHFAVRDTGIGIPPDRLNRLFQAFSQVDASTARKYGGTGLGLAVSKRLSEMMGGRMWVESEGVPGRGSTFHFTILAAPAPALKARPHAVGEQPQLRGRHVLIVDDNATNRRILTLQTQSWGMLPRATGSPQEALAWVRQGDAFDLAILDLHMPEMDGLALARALRSLRSAEQLPVILLSSLGGNAGELHADLFAACLMKPIRPSALFDALVGILSAQPVQPAQAAPARPTLDPEMASRHPLRILLAEDNGVNQKLALRQLSLMGYRADVAANGLEAIQAVERQTYDVVLMDVQMPEMDGLEATGHICARWPRGKRPRIIAMTANAMQGDREMCLNAGMDDYIAKPIRVEELVAALYRA